MKTKMMLMALVIGAMPLAHTAYSLDALVAQVHAPAQEVRATVQAMRAQQLVSIDADGRVCLTMPTELCDGCGGG